jgi:molecular chaperone GrpE
MEEKEKRDNEETQAMIDEQEEEKVKEEELKKQIEEHIDRIRHIQADFENYKKRVARERAELERLIEDRVILKFIPIYDNLERAFRSFNHNNDKDSFIEGMERIFSQFRYLLESEGVEPIEALGQRFDPALHEALLTVDHDGEPNIILEEFERGYLRQGRLLRPSRVKVSRSKPKERIESVGKEEDGDG